MVDSSSDLPISENHAELPISVNRLTDILLRISYIGKWFTDIGKYDDFSDIGKSFIDTPANRLFSHSMKIITITVKPRPIF